jgi:hypothetical protein
MWSRRTSFYAAHTLRSSTVISQWRRRKRAGAFVRIRRRDLDWIFSVQHDRTVNNDNTVPCANRTFQLNKTRWRDTLAGQTVVVEPVRAVRHKNQQLL